MGSHFDVRKYGAKGDGKTKDTASIQKAINACNKNGGGIVYFPPGNYLSGTVHLKSNVTIYLEAGAILLGSTNKRDYQLGHYSGLSLLGVGDSYLVTGNNLENIAIIGKGVIDGQGPHFWTSEMQNDVAVRPKKYRPRALIYLERCRNVSVRDVTLQNSPCFTLWLVGCETVNITGAAILNPRFGPNTDGIDIDCCQNVRVSDCHINGGDDCIALKSSADRLAEHKQPCANVTVTNCTLSTSGCGIRIGYEGDAPIKNCAFNNLAIYDTDIGIDIIVTLNPGIVKGAEIEGITLSNICMDNVVKPIYLWLGKESPGVLTGKMESISISNVTAKAKDGCYIGGISENLIKNVSLNNIKISLSGKMSGQKAIGKPGVWGGGKIPHAFYFQYINGLKLRDIQVTWENATGEWVNTLWCENVKNLEIDGFRESRGRRRADGPTIHLDNVEQTFIHGCSAAPGTDTFLEAQGKSTQKIAVIGNNLRESKRAFKIDRDLKKKVLFQTANHLPFKKL